MACIMVLSDFAAKDVNEIAAMAAENRILFRFISKKYLFEVSLLTGKRVSKKVSIIVYTDIM